MSISYRENVYIYKEKTSCHLQKYLCHWISRTQLDILFKYPLVICKHPVLCTEKVALAVLRGDKSIQKIIGGTEKS